MARCARCASAGGSSQQAGYVTILMGANDVCTSSATSMTSVDDFRAQFSATMAVLASGLPAGAHVFVSSIPNIHMLWQLFHGNKGCDERSKPDVD